jgi:hypothetical protein
MELLRICADADAVQFPRNPVQLVAKRSIKWPNGHFMLDSNSCIHYENMYFAQNERLEDNSWPDADAHRLTTPFENLNDYEGAPALDAPQARSSNGP